MRTRPTSPFGSRSDDLTLLSRYLPRRTAPRGPAHSIVAKRNAVCTALRAGAGVNRRGAPSRTDVPMVALPPPRSLRGLFLVFWFVPCFWAGRSTLKGVNFRPIRPLWWGQEWGPADTWRGQEPTRSSGHRFGRFSEAARQVASLHARPRGSCSRIGSFCDLVAAPVWVQAWVGAVGRVRNASPIQEDPVAYICRSRLRFLSSSQKRLVHP